MCGFIMKSEQAAAPGIEADPLLLEHQRRPQRPRVDDEGDDGENPRTLSN
jgi:hypothetical protein